MIGKVVLAVSLSQFMQALTMLPQIVDKVKSMDESEKEQFIEQLGLEGKEKETAYNVITCFQEGKNLSAEEQEAAQVLLEKALEINELDMSSLFTLNNQTNPEK